MSEKRRDTKGRVLRNGESQRSDGKYMFRYTDHAGRRQTIYSWKLVSADKLKDGQRGSQALREMEKRIFRDLDDGIRTDAANNTTVDDLFEQFMDIRKDLRESSRCCYRDIYYKHIQPVLGNAAVGQVRQTTIQRLYQTMVNQSGVSPATAQKAHSVIYQLFENAVLDNIIRANPASNAFRNFRKTADFTTSHREPLTVEQQTRFIDYIYASPLYNRLANLFSVLLGTGMRIGEALGLRWCDCDFDAGLVNVTHTIAYKRGEDGKYRYRVTEPKTKAGIREIPMFDEVKAALMREKRRYRANKNFVVDGYSGFIFLNSSGQVYTQSFIYDAIQGIVTSYNKEEFAKSLADHRAPEYLPKISAHILRHTFCTRMCENNVNLKILQDIMGHRDIRTTMDVYSKAMRDSKIEAIQALNGAFKIS